MVFGSPHPTETYCRYETVPLALSGVSDFVADYGLFVLFAANCNELPLFAASDVYNKLPQRVT